MGKSNVITTEAAEALLGSFRASPGRWLSAARASGVHRKTAKKAWESGLSTCPDPKYHRPFQQIIAEEQVAARAQLAEQQERTTELTAQHEAKRQEATRTRAIDDLTTERVQETQLVRMARGSTMQVLANVAQLAQGLTALGGKVRAALEATAASPEELTLRDATQVVGLIKSMATALRQCNDAGQKVMEMTRLLVGEPTSIIGHKHLKDVSVEEARRRIDASARAMRRLDDAGIEMVDGNAHEADPKLN